MIQKLPTGKFKWCENPASFTADKISILANPTAKKGYTLEVDIVYLKKLHDLHNELPFMTEKKKVNKAEKLIASLSDKKITLLTSELLSKL